MRAKPISPELRAALHIISSELARFEKTGSEVSLAHASRAVDELQNTIRQMRDATEN